MPSTLSRIETGQAPVKTSYLTVLLDLYRIDDPAERARLAGLARDGQREPWWADHDDLLPAGTSTTSPGSHRKRAARLQRPRQLVSVDQPHLAEPLSPN